MGRTLETYTCEVCKQSRRVRPHVEKPPRWCRRCYLSVAETRRSVIEGCWWEGWLYKEIAEVMGRAGYKTVGPDIDRLRRDGRIDRRVP